MIKNIFKNRRVFLTAAVLIMVGTAILAQEIGYHPRYPTRIGAIARELNNASADLVVLNQELEDLTNSCSCSNSQSQCQKIGALGIAAGSPEAIGEPCPSRKQIEYKQTEIKNKADQIAALKDLLKTEMESGLEAELKTLREDEANQLMDGLNSLINFTEQIVPPAQNNVSILSSTEYSPAVQCQAEWSNQESFGLKACILNNAGEQNPITINFRVGAGLGDLDLGRIGINQANLNLPESINVPKIKGADNFNIDLQDLDIVFDPVPVDEVYALHTDPIILRTNTPPLPKLGNSSFSCPNPSTADYSCASEEEGGSVYYQDLEWYLETYSYLSQECQTLPGINNEDGLPSQEKFEECLDKQNVHQTILNQCEDLWQQYNTCINKGISPNCSQVPEICLSLDRESQRSAAIAKECQNLFQEIEETPPSSCGLPSTYTSVRMSPG